MKEQVKDMFAEIRMPEESAEKICRAMKEKKPGTSLSRRLTAAAATVAAALVMVILVSPQAQAAVNRLVKEYFFPDSGVTIYAEADENGGQNYSVYGSGKQYFAEVRDGRLYFTGNGMNMDITDEVSMEECFIYTYEDENGFTHYMAVGGTTDNFGTYEFYRDDADLDGVWQGWAGADGQNVLDPQTNAAYPWIVDLWEKLDIPLIMPGT